MVNDMGWEWALDLLQWLVPCVAVICEIINDDLAMKIYNIYGQENMPAQNVFFKVEEASNKTRFIL